MNRAAYPRGHRAISRLSLVAAVAQADRHPCPGRHRRAGAAWPGVIAVIMTVAGCSGSPSAGTAPATSASVAAPSTIIESATTTERAPVPQPQIGDELALGELRLTVRSVEDPATPSQLQPHPGNRLVSVTFEAVNQSSVALGPADLPSVELADAGGGRYTPEHGRVGVVSASRTPGEVLAGDSMRSTLLFDVPAGATGLRVTFRSGGQAVTLPLE